MIQAILYLFLGTGDHLRSVYHTNGTPDTVTDVIRKLLDEEQDILSLLNVAFQLSCGVPPQPFQLKSL
jgi:hypothetical protein